MAPTEKDILEWRVRVPENVVYRDFPEETVILNLDTGMYHGLNLIAARMLDVLQQRATVDLAVADLTGEFDQPRERIERDVVGLCRALSERGLIVNDVDGNR